MKERLRQFLTDTERFPPALVFLGRNMRMIQGKNNITFMLIKSLILFFEFDDQATIRH